MKTRNGLLLCSLTALALGLAGGREARAADAGFAELPVGRFTAAPAKKPGWISPRESVRGLFVVANGSGGHPQERYVSIVTDERLAAGIKSANRFVRFGSEGPSGCLSESFDDDGADRKDREWPADLAPEVNGFMRSPDNPRSGVLAVHSERVVEQGEGATLESVDAWVDPNTRGAKLIAKTSLPLKLVRGPTFGVKVYAGRDERPDGKRWVQFVVVRAKSATAPRGDQMWSMRQDGSMAHSSGCGHARLALAADAKDGDTATFVVSTLLPSLTAGEPPKASASPPADKTGAQDREVRSRLMNVQVSVSQTSRDKDPLVSVSSSWGSREQVDRVADNSPED